MGLKSGIYTAGAQHIASLINSAEGIRRFLPDWDISKISKQASATWLSQQLGREVDIDWILNSIKDGNRFGASGNLSLAHWCEGIQRTRVMSGMSNEDRLYIKTN